MDALKSNSTLTELFISSCWLTSSSVDSICDMLKCNSTLQELDCSSNTYTEVDGRFVLDALRENKGLRKFDLRITGLEAAQLNSIHYILETRSTNSYGGIIENPVEEVH
jgi:Leucine-rich repeat (LRR) protein